MSISALYLGVGAKSVKRRAPQACEGCRARKVRCDVAKHGAPCVHCKMDDVECIVRESKRNKKRRKVSEPSAATESRSVPTSGSSALPVGAADSSLSYSDGQPDLIFDPDGRFFETPAPSASMLQHLNQLPAEPNVASRTRTLSYARVETSSNDGLPWSLPSYIKPLPDRFGTDDITYLQNKGALTIPHTELRNELLRSYIEHVHPFMPLLDCHRFAEIIDRNDATMSISLLLFQAVMFAGVATADLSLLKAEGHDTRREARRIFFSRIRLLYDLDYEDDSIALVQSLLLMTYWREDPTGRKETHHWIEVAVSLSQKIGLHRNPDHTTTLELWQRKLHKRIWWSAYIRDCQIALGQRKSTCIKDVDFDVPMLQLEDFELNAPSDDPQCVPAGCKLKRDPDMQRKMAIMCIEMTRLSLCISHILSAQHGVTNAKGSLQTVMMLFQETSQPEADNTQLGATALHTWKVKLPEAAQYRPATHKEVDAGDSCLALNLAFLHMMYYAGLSALHRPRTLRLIDAPLDKRSVETVRASQEVVRDVATRITSMVATLHNLDLVRYLPSPTITVLLPAIVIHLSDVLAPSRTLRRESLQDFCKCMQIMSQLKDMYAAADYSTAFLQAAIHSTEIGPRTDEGPPTGGPSHGVVPTSEPSTGEEGYSRHHHHHHQQHRFEPFLISAEPSPDPRSYYGQSLGPPSHDLPDPTFDASVAMPMAPTNSNNNNTVGFDFAGPARLGSTGDHGSSLGGMPTTHNDNSNANFAFDTDWLMGLGAEGLMFVGER